MRRLFELVGEISVTGLEACKKGLDEIEDYATKADKAFTKFGRQASSVGKTLSKYVTAPIIGGAAAMVLATDKVGEYALGLQKLEQQSGLSTDTLQEMSYVAKKSGITVDDMSAAILKFTKNLSGSELGSNKVAVGLRQLGLSAYDSNGKLKDMNELFPEMLKRLNEIPNVTQRNAIAMQIFGKGAGVIAPILKLTGAEMDALREKAHNLGIVMGKDAIDAAVKYRSEMVDLKEQGAALFRNLASDLIPIMKDTFIPLIQTKIIPAIKGFAEKIRDAINWFRGLDESTKANIIGFTAFLAIIGPTVLGIGKGILILHSLKNALFLAATAVKGLSIAMATNPFVLIAAGAVAACAALVLMNQELSKYKTPAVSDDDVAYNKLLEERAKYQDICNKNMGDEVELYGVKGKLNKQVLDYSKQELKDLDEHIAAYEGGTEALAKYNAEHAKAVKAGSPAKKPEGTDTTLMADEIKFRDEYNKKILENSLALTRNLDEQTKKRIEINNKDKEAAIKAARLQGYDTAIITKYYADEENRILTEASRAKEDIERDAGLRMLDAVGNAESAKTRFVDDQRNLQIASLERAKNEEIRKAKEKGLSILNIEKTYQAQIDQLNFAARISKEDQEKELFKNTIVNKRELLKFEEDADIKKAREAGLSEEAITNIQKAYKEKRKQLTLEEVQTWISSFAEIGSQIGAIFSTLSNNKQIETDNWYKKEKSAIENSEMLSVVKQKKLKALDAEYDKKNSELKRKQAQQDKKLAIFNSIVNTIEGVTKALTLLPPFSWILAGIVGAMGAAQTAAIAAQPIPLKEGALIKGNRGGILAQIGEGAEDELVLPIKTFWRGLRDQFTGMGLPSFAAPAPAMAGAGMRMRPVENHYHIGTLVADDRGLKELERRQSKFRISEAQRMGQNG